MMQEEVRKLATADAILFIDNNDNNKIIMNDDDAVVAKADVVVQMMQTLNEEKEEEEEEMMKAEAKEDEMAKQQKMGLVQSVKNNNKRSKTNKKAHQQQQQWHTTNNNGTTATTGNGNGAPQRRQQTEEDEQQPTAMSSVTISSTPTHQPANAFQTFTPPPPLPPSPRGSPSSSGPASSPVVRSRSCPLRYKLWQQQPQNGAVAPQSPSIVAAMFSVGWRQTSAKCRDINAEQHKQPAAKKAPAMTEPTVAAAEAMDSTAALICSQPRISSEERGSSISSNCGDLAPPLLSEMSQEVLAQIIRQFPFSSSTTAISCPSPHSSPQPLMRTLSHPGTCISGGNMAPPLCTPTPFDDEQQQQHQESVLALLQQQEQMAAEKNAQPCKPIEAKANDAEERRQNVATLNKMPANQAQQLPTIQQTTNEEAMGGGTAAAAVVNAVTELAASVCHPKPDWQTRAADQLNRLRRVASNLSINAVGGGAGGQKQRRDRPRNLPLFSRCGAKFRNGASGNGGGGTCVSALSQLCKVSVNTMAITALPLDCWLKERLKNWVQLSGHQGTIVPASNHSLWKKQPQGCQAEALAYADIMRDPALRGVTPKFFRQIVHRNETFIEIQDLLAEFPKVESRAVMDIKIGTRTFLECEVANQHKRADLYRKMVELAPEEPTEQERMEGAITKRRYMQFRERRSTSATLGFRIEAAQMPGAAALQKDFKRVCSACQVHTVLMHFFGPNHELIRRQLLARLRQIRAGVANSKFFRTHEVVGSSLLLVHDGTRAGAWLIDFAKCHRLAQQQQQLGGGAEEAEERPDDDLGGNGYLTGLDSMLAILEPGFAAATNEIEAEEKPKEEKTGVEEAEDNNTNMQQQQQESLVPVLDSNNNDDGHEDDDRRQRRHGTSSNIMATAGDKSTTTASH